ncbi:hypothetical protein [Sulfitobacter sp. R18_1]|uniref:hypothetical protein n=1 Tax=Sulfitobacter sp. R18_1 TaxID=2821104 RepID=UPI001ADB772E|nr:hypothetical protein [Sulfitobacter sp. R18_1]MBO9429553.1 hypothetical protein [Sulfitobacter sp. R18_1]
MDRMLDNNLHIDLPTADVSAFFKAELARCVASVHRMRMVERMDGSLTAKKMQRNRLETFVLRGMVEHGLSEDIAAERLHLLEEDEKPIAQDIQASLFREFISPGFNAGVQMRAKAESGLSQLEVLQLRWAAVEARMAAHEAAETVPLHNAKGARDSAVSMLRTLMQEAVGGVAPVSTTIIEPHLPSVPVEPHSSPAKLPYASSPIKPLLTPGVSLIEGRMTGNAIIKQFDVARQQPKDVDFDGSAENVVVERSFGDDIAGTAVRMIWRSTAQEDTKEQKLKSVTLFMYLTGVQRMSNIRQHHFDSFSKLLETRMPPTYWKRKLEFEMTSHELIEEATRLGKTCGMKPATIQRHVDTLAALLEHARSEGNVTDFVLNKNGLIPVDERSDDEKREPFTLGEMQSLFAHTLWQGCQSRKFRQKPGSLVIQDHHYWVNLLLGYTGARRAEIAGLLVDDLGLANEIPYVHIRPNHLRGLKNAAARRRIPLHPHLMELGFAEFVEAARKRNWVALFPQAVPENIRHLAHNTTEHKDVHDPKFGDVLDYMLRTSLEKALNGNPRKLSCHGFRHYVNDHFISLRQDDGISLAIPDIDRLDLLGHKPKDVNLATYRRAEKPLGPLYQAILTLPRLF